MSDTLYVPVRMSGAGVLALRTGRLESGERIGLAFTSEASLSFTLGAGQRWVMLGEQSLRGLLAPLGVRRLRVDPAPAWPARCGRDTPSGAQAPRPAPVRPGDPGPHGRLGHDLQVAARASLAAALASVCPSAPQASAGVSSGGAARLAACPPFRQSALPHG
jgi:hypothetical protein